MELSHTVGGLSAVFDEPNLIASGGLVAAVGLMGRVGLEGLGEQFLTVPGSKDCAGAKLMSLVAGMVAGADSIDDLDLLRHGGMGKVFTGVRAPSTLGSFLRAFSFGHVRQLDAVAARALGGLAQAVPGLLPSGDGRVFLDIDDTIKAVFGVSKQGAEHGYTRVRGLNAQLGVISSSRCAPVIAGARLRRGAAASVHGAVRLVRDAIAVSRRAGVTGEILLRADSAYYSHALIEAVTKAGARFSITVRGNPAVRRAIAELVKFSV